MSIDVHYDPEKRALYGVFSGDLSVEEFVSTLKEAVSANLYPPSVRTIWDLTGLNFSTISRETIYKLIHVRATQQERHPAKIAFVAPDDLGFGMLRMYEIIGDNLGDEIKVFRDYSEAEAWLLQEQQ